MNRWHKRCVNLGLYQDSKRESDIAFTPGTTVTNLMATNTKITVIKKYVQIA